METWKLMNIVNNYVQSSSRPPGAREPENHEIVSRWNSRSRVILSRWHVQSWVLSTNSSVAQRTKARQGLWEALGIVLLSPSVNCYVPQGQGNSAILKRKLVVRKSVLCIFIWTNSNSCATFFCWFACWHCFPVMDRLWHHVLPVIFIGNY